MSSNSDILIIGGGLAGLCCALRLHQSGLSFQVLEASDGVGRRVRTDRINTDPQGKIEKYSLFVHDIPI